jgi:hypothetical protein
MDSHYGVIEKKSMVKGRKSIFYGVLFLFPSGKPQEKALVGQDVFERDERSEK